MKSFFMAIWFVLAMVGFALAGGDIAAAQESPFAAFMNNTVQPLLSSLLATIVAAAVTYITLVFKKKFGLEISNATQARISGIAYDAVNAVEEKGAAYLKERGEKWASQCKYNEALNYVLSKVPTLTREEADAKIHSVIAGVKGIGATSELGA